MVAQLEEMDCVSAVELKEQAGLDDLAEHPPGIGALWIRANPFEFLDPRRFITNPLQCFLNLAEDSAYFAREGSRTPVPKLCA